eukprot:1158846-Pelagomonas_calceolata.AAC.7
MSTPRDPVKLATELQQASSRTRTLKAVRSTSPSGSGRASGSPPYSPCCAPGTHPASGRTCMEAKDE